MYKLRIGEGGEKAAPPALILATSPEYLEFIRQAEDREGFISGLAGALAIEEFIREGEQVGFGGSAVVDQVSAEEVHLVLGMPPKEFEHGLKHQKTKTIAANIHVFTRVLNSFYDKNRSRFPRPQVQLTTTVSVEPDSYYGHYMSARFAPELTKEVSGLSEEERSVLESRTGRVVTLFADHLLTPTDSSTVGANIGDDPGTVRVEWRGDPFGLRVSDRGDELVGDNIDTAAKQIILIGGLATMATYATSQVV